MNLSGFRQAIYTRLAGYAPFASQVVAITDEPDQAPQPEKLTDFPYVVISDVSVQAWDTKSSDGARHLVQVSVFTRPTGSASATEAAKAIAQSAYDALHNYALPISGSNTVVCQFADSPGTMTDRDGVTRHHPMTFRVLYDDGT